MCTLGSIINLTKLNVIFCVYSLVSICSSAFFPHHRPLAAFFSPLVQLFVPTRLHAFPSATIASRYFPLYLLILVFFLPRSHISLLSCTQASSRAHAHTCEQGHAGHFVCPLATLKPYPSKHNHTSSVCW